MPDYRFKAYTATGSIESGVIAAVSKQAATGELTSRHLVPFEVAVDQGGQHKQRPVSTKTLANFCRQMSGMIAGGLPVDEALKLLADHSPPATSALSEHLREAVLSGSTLADAFATSPGRIPSFMVGLVAAGEAGDTLSSSFTRLADEFETQIKLQDQMKSALIYPIILFIASFASLSIVLLVVTPALAPVFNNSGAEPPLSAQLMLSASDLARKYGAWLLLALLLGGWACARLLMTSAGKRLTDRLALRTPLIGDLVRDAELSRFLFTLSSLLENGVHVTAALPTARESLRNSVIQSEISILTDQVRKGDDLGKGFASSRSTPPLVAQMALAGSRSGSLPTMLGQAGRLLNDSAQQRVKAALTAAAPVITVVLGIVVGAVVLSLLSAIMSVNDIALAG